MNEEHTKYMNPRQFNIGKDRYENMHIYIHTRSETYIIDTWERLYLTCKLSHYEWNVPYDSISDSSKLDAADIFNVTIWCMHNSVAMCLFMLTNMRCGYFFAKQWSRHLTEVGVGIKPKAVFIKYFIKYNIFCWLIELRDVPHTWFSTRDVLW